MKPPSGGPITGAINAGQTSSAVIDISSCLPARRNARMRPIANINPPEAPCTTRATTSCGRFIATPQPIDASTKPPSASRQIRRPP